MTHPILPLLALLGVAAPGCLSANVDGKGDASKPQELTESSKSVYTSLNQFGLELLREADKGGGNVAISPFSAHSALSLLANGARDRTKTEILKLLRLDGESVDDLNNAHSHLVASNDDQLSSYNAVFLTGDLKPSSEFQKIVEDKYRATIGNTSDSDPTAVNNWVKQKTKDRIPKLIEKFPPNTVFLTVNATVFDGEWLNSFDVKRTLDHPFEREDGSKADVKMMSASESALRLPGDWVGGALDFKGERLRAVFLMPKRGGKLSDLMAALTPEKIREAAQAEGKADQNISIPRFEVRHKQNLMQPLRAMGGEYLLAPNDNDYSPLVPGTSKGDLWIGDALQETVVEFDEKGARGAAATAFIGLTRASIEEPLVFSRPFVWMIVDRETGAMMLTGTFHGPSS